MRRCEEMAGPRGKAEAGTEIALKSSSRLASRVCIISVDPHEVRVQALFENIGLRGQSWYWTSKTWSWRSSQPKHHCYESNGADDVVPSPAGPQQKRPPPSCPYLFRPGQHGWIRRRNHHQPDCVLRTGMQPAAHRVCLPSPVLCIPVL